MNNQEKFNKIYPFLSGLTYDLLFFIAIDTLFLKVVVGLTDSEIVLSTSIALIARLLLQPLFLMIIKKIGNTASVRLGTFLLIVSACLYTIGKNFITIIFAKIIYNIAFVFRDMIEVILKNNLEVQNKSELYSKIRSHASTIYAIITMIISLVATFMFNISPYFPMACCIFFTVLCFILSFFIKEETLPVNKTENSENKDTQKSHSKIHFNFAFHILLGILIYALFYSIVALIQTDGKLFIQNKLLEVETLEKTTIIIGIIQFISRIIRVVGNALYSKLANKLKDNLGNIFSIFLVLSAVLFVVGSLISNFILRISVMSVGFFITLFIRDPGKIFLQDYVMSNVEQSKRQSALSTMEFLNNVFKALFTLLFGVILIGYDFVIVYIILGIFALIEATLCIILFSKIKKNIELKNQKTQNNI